MIVFLIKRVLMTSVSLIRYGYQTDFFVLLYVFQILLSVKKVICEDFSSQLGNSALQSLVEDRMVQITRRDAFNAETLGTYKHSIDNRARAV